MENLNNNLSYLNTLENNIRVNWNNKNLLEEYQKNLPSIKKNFGSFNLYFAFLGLAGTHTFIIYSKKLVLHQMEKKAIPHIGLCLGAGLLAGFVVGNIYGSSYKLSKKYSSVESLLNQRLSQIK